jgi:hypothetical protein
MFATLRKGAATNRINIQTGGRLCCPITQILIRSCRCLIKMLVRILGSLVHAQAFLTATDIVNRRNALTITHDSQVHPPHKHMGTGLRR